ncbi:MAG: hypothetical protein ABJN40_13305 [Sneathiella sp.]
MSDETAMKVSINLQDIGEELEGIFQRLTGQRVCFSLFAWTEGNGSYVSNSIDRDAVKAELLQIIDRWDDGMPDIPLHKKH